MKRFLGVIFLSSTIAGAVVFLNVLVFIHTPSGETSQNMVVEKGMSVDWILSELEKREVISNVPLFKAYLMVMRAEGQIRAGEYTFPPRLKPRDLLSMLMKGDFATYRITLPEGWTVREIASYLEEKHLVTSDLFIQKCSDPIFIQSLGVEVSNLEGYLYPDTYELYKPKNEEEVLKKFIARFLEIYSREFEVRAKESGLSRAEIVTLASIVEKETGQAAERPLIASVFLNRLKKGIPLATDPAIIYGIINFSGNLTRQDLTSPGPYNTYLNAGLPPTPISNPGKESLRAVLYPATTNYLYFVSKNDGTHFFSETEAEHNAAVQKYQINPSRQAAETMPGNQAGLP